jgi:hypothetical protein
LVDGRLGWRDRQRGRMQNAKVKVKKGGKLRSLWDPGLSSG